jgi:hypothetical protein
MRDNTKTLAQWVQSFLPAGVAQAPSLSLHPVAGDAGFRSYYRTNTQPSLIAVCAPPEHEDSLSFVRKGLSLRAGSVHVPEIFAVDYRHGFLLLEDLGDALYLPLLNESSADGLYGRALNTLAAIQALPVDETLFPPYGERLLRDEMSLFPRWFVGELLGMTLDDGERDLIESLFARLVASALAQPRAVVHRDYHSRNLLDLGDDVGVVDFQDAVTGPVTYDLVSLLKDCYIRWPRERVAHWALAYPGRHETAAVDDAQWLLWFDWMGLQRHLKVLGIFARLSIRDHKNGYLKDLPLVVRYTLEVAGHYPEFREFHRWFSDRLVPALHRQPWYQPWETAGE